MKVKFIKTLAVDGKNLVKYSQNWLEHDTALSAWK